ncbi:MAG: hypothetical protein ACRDT8_09965 [Micromonosporaceae bacterium]
MVLLIEVITLQEARVKDAHEAVRAAYHLYCKRLVAAGYGLVGNHGTARLRHRRRRAPRRHERPRQGAR